MMFLHAEVAVVYIKLSRTPKNNSSAKVCYTSHMTVTFDLPPEIASRLDQKAAQEGQDMAEYLRRLAFREAEAEEHTVPKPRVPGLHAGRYWIAEDFDAPLPESFWLGAEDPASEADRA